eukprot:751232-Hanusia_phi.AAC.1
MLRALIPLLLVANAMSSPNILGSQARRAGAAWNYNLCDSSQGPKHWGGVCETGKQQSPIDLCGAKAFDGSAPSLKFDSANWNTASKFNIKNTGHALQLDVVNNAPILDSGNLAFRVGRQSADGTATWKLAQMHFHWGRSASEGSEHYIQGVQYPLEAHFVHFNTKYATITEAVSSGNSDALLVVGQMYTIGEGEPVALATIGDEASRATTDGVAMNADVNFGQLVDDKSSFYSYAGSLTTPGCNQVVTWVVMQTPKTVSTATMDKFWAVTIPGSSEKFAQYGNYRPLQPLDSRTIYTSGTSSSPCATHGVKEPDFGCSSDSSASRNLTIVSAVLGSVLGVTLLGIAIFAARFCMGKGPSTTASPNVSSLPADDDAMKAKQGQTQSNAGPMFMAMPSQTFSYMPNPTISLG